MAARSSNMCILGEFVGMGSATANDTTPEAIQSRHRTDSAIQSNVIFAAIHGALFARMLSNISMRLVPRKTVEGPLG
jgi:hypothetical protein